MNKKIGKKVRTRNAVILLLGQVSSSNLARSRTFFLVTSQTWIINDFMNVFNGVYLLMYFLAVAFFTMDFLHVCAFQC